MEIQETHCQNNLKKNKAIGFILPYPKLTTKLTVANMYQDMRYQQKDRHTDQWTRFESLRINPNIYSQLIFDKDSNQFKWIRIIFSTNSAGSTGYRHARE